MEPFVIDMGMALWFGVLTSISPCPLASNIAAISFLGKQVDNRFGAVRASLFYTLGRTATYVALAAVLVSSSQLIPQVSMFLQRYMNRILGPVLLITGVLLLDIVKLRFSTAAVPEKLQKRLATAGGLGAFLLGALFALTFCPVSAAFFFGSTFALAVRHNSAFVLPGLYGVGTAAPVVAFALVLAFSTHALGAMFKRVTVFEKWARRTSGVVFVGVGVYLVLRHTLRLF
jgi:cytochrome c-type biogenesis protein